MPVAELGDEQSEPQRFARFVLMTQDSAAAPNENAAERLVRPVFQGDGHGGPRDAAGLPASPPAGYSPDCPNLQQRRAFWKRERRGSHTRLSPRDRDPAVASQQMGEVPTRAG